MCTNIKHIFCLLSFLLIIFLSSCSNHIDDESPFPPFSDTLLQSWGIPKEDVLEDLCHQGLEPLDHSERTYVFSGTLLSDGNDRYIKDGKLPYLDHEWGLTVYFGDPSIYNCINHIDYDTYIDNGNGSAAKDTIALAEEITEKYISVYGEPMKGTEGSSTDFYWAEHSTPTLENLKESDFYVTVWDIPSEDLTDGIYTRAILYIIPRFELESSVPTGYYLRIRYLQTERKDWY